MEIIQIGNITTRDVTNLPNDLFYLVLSYLQPEDCIVSRRVSKTWLATFTTDGILRTLLRWHFPQAREVRAGVGHALPPSLSPSIDHPAWNLTGVFDKVARRYHNLRNATVHEIEKIEVADEITQGGKLFWAVEPWRRWFEWYGNTATFQYHNPAWCVDDGLLIYAGPDGRILAYDLSTRLEMTVRFDTTSRTLRKLALKCDVLIIEWCDREPYDELDDEQFVHRHYATAFDVRPTLGDTGDTSTDTDSDVDMSLDGDGAGFPWTVVFRCEWKIAPHGLVLNNKDSFFSTHTSTHYAVYIWHPRRSSVDDTDPHERLTVWDISSTSECHPCLAYDENEKVAAVPESAAPRTILNLCQDKLSFYNLSQENTPSLCDLSMDENSLYVHEEEHRWLTGPQSSSASIRNHTVRCTGLPLTGIGPRWFDRCCADGGNIHLSFCPRTGSVARQGSELSKHNADIDATEGRRYQQAYDNACGLSLAPCWRHEEFPYLTVSQVVDAGAGIRIAARQCFVMEILSNFAHPQVFVEALDHSNKPASDSTLFANDMWGEFMGRGLLCGDERWLIGEDGGGSVSVARF